VLVDPICDGTAIEPDVLANPRTGKSTFAVPAPDCLYVDLENRGDFVSSE
jgi:hypothetical protein